MMWKQFGPTYQKVDGAKLLLRLFN